MERLPGRVSKLNKNVPIYTIEKKKNTEKITRYLNTSVKKKKKQDKKINEY